MKQMWIEANRCTGCGACADICPQKAITMEQDECGFIHPNIGIRCVDCHLCEKICLKREERENTHYMVPITYAAWSKDSDIRFCSTSGGVFSELAFAVLHRSGEVAGAQYRADNLVEHIIIKSEKELYKIRQSKYIQSHPNGIYLAVKKSLVEGKPVLFCGAPCQVAALYAYLGKEYDNLTTVDFICRGMNSPKAYSCWLKEIERMENSRVTRVWFKYKEGGWKSSPRRTRLDFEDGHSVIKSGTDNLFMNGYLTSNLYIRPSCGHCSFKGVPRQGDLTIADFWGIEESLDDDKGTSLVLINSDKGVELFNSANRSLIYQKREFDEIFEGNVCFTDSVSVPVKSYDFLCSLDTMPFSIALKKYSSIPLHKKILKKIKRIMGSRSIKN